MNAIELFVHSGLVVGFFTAPWFLLRSSPVVGVLSPCWLCCHQQGRRAHNPPSPRHSPRIHERVDCSSLQVRISPPTGTRTICARRLHTYVQHTRASPDIRRSRDCGSLHNTPDPSCSMRHLEHHVGVRLPHPSRKIRVVLTSLNSGGLTRRREPSR